MMKITLYLFLLSLALRTLPVQAQSPERILKAYFAEVREGKYRAIPQNLSLPEESENTLRALEPYVRDTSSSVRAKAYAIVQLVGYKARRPSAREQAVTILVNGVKDADGGNSGMVLRYLDDFRKEDFTMATRDTVAALYFRTTAYVEKLVRLVGFLELTSLQSSLRTLVQQPDVPKKNRWAATLALARMGDGYAVENMMKRVRKLPVTDEVVYDIFPDLVYTRRREAVEWMLQALNNDEKNCSSADAESNIKIPCAYRVMEMLAPAIQNYPLTVDETGDVVTDDYAQALHTVREWFKKNPRYTMDTDRQ